MRRLALLCLVGLMACKPAPAPAPAAGVTVVDTSGRTVTVPARVERVVSLAPSVTEILFAVGAGPLVIATDRYSDYPPAVKTLAKVGSDLEPSLERIVGLRPDIVFTATTANARETTEALARVGIPVYVSRDQSLADVEHDLEGIAAAVGRAEEGRRARAAFHAGLAALRRAPDAGAAVPTLVVVWPEPLVVAGAGSHVDELLALVGGRNIAVDEPQGAPAAQPYPTFSLERVVARAPEVIVVGTHSDGAPPLGALERLRVPAVEHKRIRLVDGDLLFRPGPRLVDGARALAQALRP